MDQNDIKILVNQMMNVGKKRSIFFKIFETMIWASFVATCLYWYNWRLLVVIALGLWAYGLQLDTKK